MLLGYNRIMIGVFIPGAPRSSFKDHLNSNVDMVYYLQGNTFILSFLKMKKDNWICVYNIFGLLEVSINLNTGVYTEINSFFGKKEVFKKIEKKIMILNNKDKSKTLKNIDLNSFDGFNFKNFYVLEKKIDIFKLTESDLDTLIKTLGVPHYTLVDSEGEDCLFYWNICTCNIISLLMFRMNLSGNIKSIVKYIPGCQCKKFSLVEDGVDEGGI